MLNISKNKWDTSLVSVEEIVYAVSNGHPTDESQW